MITNLFENKKFAASLSVLSNLILIIIKLVTGFISGSVSIISEAIHSASDFLASVITFFAVHKSESPADKDHQFGHGKYEDVAGFIEGCLIILAAAYIIFEAAKKLTGEIEPFENSMLGIAVMFVSVLTNIFVSTYLMYVAKKTDSIAIYSDAQHLRTDIFSSFTVFVGLIIIEYTGLHIIDSLIAVIVAMIIMHTGYRICKTSMNDILDGSLPEEDIKEIQNILKNNMNTDNLSGIAGIKEIKTRKAGKDKDIVIALFVDGNMTIRDAHKLCDKLENEIENKLGNTKITIHLEPADCDCVCCQNIHI